MMGFRAMKFGHFHRGHFNSVMQSKGRAYATLLLAGRHHVEFTHLGQNPGGRQQARRLDTIIVGQKNFQRYILDFVGN